MLLVVAIAPLAGATALAAPSRTFETDLTIEAAPQLPDEAIDVTGAMDSKGSLCEYFRAVVLVDRRHSGRPAELAFGVSSSPAGVWRLRTAPHPKIKGTLIAKVPPQRIRIVSVGVNRTEHRRTVVCEGARERVQLP